MNKQTVDLSAPGVRGSRIRRAPPPKETGKVLTPHERREREKKRALIGIVATAIAIAIIIVGFNDQWGFSLSQYTVEMK